MCKCNGCGREITNDYGICEFCDNKDRLFRQELIKLLNEYQDDLPEFYRQFRKLQFKYDNCK